MSKLKYASSIKDMPFMFFEMRRTAQLMCKGKSADQIITLSMNKNIYQLNREKRRRDVPQRMLKRLGTLNEQLIEVVASGSEGDAKLVAFLALIKVDCLFYEYMREVYSDLFRSGKTDITDKDFMDFIERKAQESDTVAKWTNTTLIRIRNAYTNILCETGLAKSDGSVLIIQKPYIQQEIHQLFDEENAVFARAMLLEV